MPNRRNDMREDPDFIITKNPDPTKFPRPECENKPISPYGWSFHDSFNQKYCDKPLYCKVYKNGKLEKI